jgi:heme iron utilization protein
LRGLIRGISRAKLCGYGAEVVPRDHGDPGDAPSVPPPLTAVVNPRRPSAAEEARTIAASTNTATLASLTADGDPWASFVTYGLLDGSPVLCVSRLAEHGRNLAVDPRASIAIVAPTTDPDPLASGRITLGGLAERPAGDELASARDAHLAAVAAAKYYIDYSDFSLWVLRVQRVRWVGGYGRMDSATGEQYAAAEPDPVVPHAASAMAHLNADHADSLVAMARALGGYPDTVSATCTGADRYGLNLKLTTVRGPAYTRVGYLSPIGSIHELRSATAQLARQALSQPTTSCAVGTAQPVPPPRRPEPQRQSRPPSGSH